MQAIIPLMSQILQVCLKKKAFKNKPLLLPQQHVQSNFFLYIRQSNKRTPSIIFASD